MAATKVRLELRSGTIIGGGKIRRTIQAATRATGKRAKRLVMQEMSVHMPRRTGALRTSAMNTLRPGHLDRGGLHVGAPSIPYAPAVNAYVPPIRWTNPSSWYHWMDKTGDLLLRLVSKYFDQEVKRLGLAQKAGLSRAATVREFEVSI